MLFRTSLIALMTFFHHPPAPPASPVPRPPRVCLASC